MSALHVFDMDGTLLRGTTAPIELSRRLNRLEPLADLENADENLERVAAVAYRGESLLEAYALARDLLGRRR